MTHQIKKHWFHAVPRLLHWFLYCYHSSIGTLFLSCCTHGNPLSSLYLSFLPLKFLCSYHWFMLNLSWYSTGSFVLHQLVFHDPSLLSFIFLPLLFYWFLHPAPIPIQFNWFLLHTHWFNWYSFAVIFDSFNINGTFHWVLCIYHFLHWWQYYRYHWFMLHYTGISLVPYPATWVFHLRGIGVRGNDKIQHLYWFLHPAPSITMVIHWFLCIITGLMGILLLLSLMQLHQ